MWPSLPLTTTPSPPADLLRAAPLVLSAGSRQAGYSLRLGLHLVLSGGSGSLLVLLAVWVILLQGVCLSSNIPTPAGTWTIRRHPIGEWGKVTRWPCGGLACCVGGQMRRGSVARWVTGDGFAADWRVRRGSAARWWGKQLRVAAAGIGEYRGALEKLKSAMTIRSEPVRGPANTRRCLPRRRFTGGRVLFSIQNKNQEKDDDNVDVAGGLLDGNWEHGLRAVAVSDGDGSRLTGTGPVRQAIRYRFVTDGYGTGRPVDGNTRPRPLTG
ncbi:hypothetical protein K438DRAFT_1765223 [Mycena galopus ATCC 62051]|nr:hypothetical protein K438DRAFT_1765223 [Mycena galopus ATCC 62051]